MDSSQRVGFSVFPAATTIFGTATVSPRRWRWTVCHKAMAKSWRTHHLVISFRYTLGLVGKVNFRSADWGRFQASRLKYSSEVTLLDRMQVHIENLSLAQRKVRFIWVYPLLFFNRRFILP